VNSNKIKNKSSRQNNKENKDHECSDIEVQCNEAKEQAEAEPNAKSSTKQQTNVVTSKNKQHKKDSLVNKKSEALKAIINPHKKEKSDTKSHQKMQEGLLAKGKRKGGKKRERNCIISLLCCQVHKICILVLMAMHYLTFDPSMVVDHFRS
jgi:hypothetical protein